MSGPKQIGVVKERVINLLNLKIEEGSPILCGESNIEHMKADHPDDYNKYGSHLKDIINNPTYVAKHPKKDSIEYIKVFTNGDEHVLVAVRATTRGSIFARTLFVMDPEKVEKYENKKAFIKY
jgi:hypothetical protein